jgi:transcriptional regulator with GAF, ATPase, and Fis domain
MLKDPTGASPNGKGGPSSSSTGRSRDLGQLAYDLSDVARQLQAEETVERTLQAILIAAVETIPGADCASISTVRHRRAVHTVAATDDLARAVDDAQYAAGEGPCLDTLYQQRTVRLSDLAVEQRWPQFVARARELGVGSMLALQLFVDSEELGALNLISEKGDAFTDESEQVGLLFAAHAAVAMADAQEQRNLRSAIETRELIGQAQGILMERFKITAHEAFRVLVHASQATNVPVREISAQLALTGEVAGLTPS